jgi:hypothetical protein
LTALRLAHLHGVPLLVDLAVERRWPATGGAASAAVGGLIAGLGDSRSDTASAQPGTVAARAVRLVGQDPRRPAAGRAATEAGHRDRVQHRGELRAIPGLPTGDQHRQRTLALLASQVQLGAQPTA